MFGVYYRLLMAVWVVCVVGIAGWPCCRQLLQVQAFDGLYDRTAADAEGGLAAGGCGSIAVQVQLPRRRP